MTFTDIAPFVIAAVVVAVIIWIKVATMRLNKKLKKEGKDPIPEQEIVNVIDWTRK